LVTGGGTGIGLAIATALEAAGADVAVTYRTHPPAGDERPAFQVHATDEGQVVAAVDQAVTSMGGLDVLVNNVGGLVRRATLAELDLATWREVLAVNLDSMFLFSHHSLPHLLQGGGRIVNVASLAAHSGGHPGALA
jgi:3-oxoacyl-[acyl-carrier protein] reductase